MPDSSEPESIASILEAYKLKKQQLWQAPAAPPVAVRVSTPPPASIPVEPPEPELELPSGRYDVDLSEFPLFRFYKPRLTKHDPRMPLTYADTITGKDGQPVARQWKLYAGAFGFGGASAQALLFDLFQVWAENSFRGTQIQFGTLRSLYQRRGHRHPSARDYVRLRHDIEVLRGYDLHASNAFWDKERQCYVDMNWRLFGAVFYFKEKPDDKQLILPFGFIEVSPVLQQIARTRGFFAVGFDSRFFHALKPLEQRLALYLAKKFLSQSLHRRYVDDLAHALPIEANRPNNVRMILKQAAHGLLKNRLPILASFEFEKARDSRWLAVFHRKALPKQDAPLPKYAAKELAPAVEALVDRIIEATDNPDDRPWWTQCAKRLGQGGVDRALGQLKEAKQLAPVKNPGGLLTKIFKDISKETGIALQD